MSIQIQIKEIRLSFIQFEILADPLKALNPPPIPFSFLLSGAAYGQQWRALFQGASTVGADLLPPWHKGYAKLFWKYYAPQRQPGDLWRSMVPFRRACVPVTASWLAGATPGTATAAAYLYPWGIGVVMDVEAKLNLDLDQTVQFAFQTERSGKYILNGDAGKEYNMKPLMSQLIEEVRTEAYAATPQGQQGEIFSIVSVLDADGVDTMKVPQDGQEVHQALEAFTNWNPLYKKLALKPLKDYSIEIKTSPASHVLYGGKRGRAIWFPEQFKNVAPYPDSVTCYHRNLTIATLQTESLCRFMAEIAVILNAGGTLANTSVAYSSAGKLSAGILGRLYGGAGTYRSHSIQVQIDKSYKVEVNRVRNGKGGYGMPAL